MQGNHSTVDLIIYRVNDKGLEVFVQENGSNAQIRLEALNEDNLIHLEPFTDDQGEKRQAVAVEADWHDIPSLRALILEDIVVAKQKAKDKLKDMIHELDPEAELDKGAYIAVKDAFKRALPSQYAFLKELKDVVLEKNSVKYV